MSTEFCLPDLGEGLTESEIVSWHVSVGDHVVADQPLVSVETDKAIVDVPSPRAGTVVRLCAQPGDLVDVGAPLIEFDGPQPDHGAVVGELASTREAGDAHTVSGEVARPTGAVRASPAVRQQARTLGVALDQVEPSGPGGSVTVDDVVSAARSRPSTGGRAHRWQRLQGVRRSMARQMTQAGAQVVPATITDLADIDAWTADTDPTLRLVRAVRAGCDAEPALNAWYDASAMSRRLHDDLHLGLAVDTEDGLIVPVINLGADERVDDDTLKSRIDARVKATRDRTLGPPDLSGASFTLSNFGTLGGRHGALVVVPPQVGILGAGAIRDDAVVIDGTVTVHRVMPLSLTFDHRAVSGSEAARFIGAVVAALEVPSHRSRP